MPKSIDLSHSARALHAPETEDNIQLGKVDVGSRLRALREMQRFSIRALAEASGLAVNTLSLIENGKTSPSVSTLQQIAAALGQPITAFFEPERTRSRLIFQKCGERDAAAFTHGSIADLGAGMETRKLEPLLITLEAGAGSGSQLIVHPGQEFIYCLEGRIHYIVAEQDYYLEPGDSLIFDSTMPHSWANPDQSPSRALLILSP
jgi:transcriptional regulator with XRE-family HTH domain